MTNALDIILIAGGAYYIGSRLKDSKDNEFKRLLLGTGIGVPVALAGPEVYQEVKDRMQDSPESKDRLASAAIFGVAGYLLGDKILGGKKQPPSAQTPPGAPPSAPTPPQSPTMKGYTK